MFEKWFPAFGDDGSGGVLVSTVSTTGDNGTPAKDLNTMMSQVITAQDKVRVVVTV